MSYIKDNTALIGEILHLGYIKNKDGRTTNPTLHILLKLDLLTNKIITVGYSVKCFDDKDTYGYTRESFESYDKAKECYDSLFPLYHIA